MALVTGGGTGIGRAVAERLAKGGAAVAVVGRRGRLLAEVVEVLAAWAPAVAVEADVRDAAAVAAAVARVTEDLGPVGLAVSCAGVPGEGVRVDEVSDELWDEIVDTNLRGPFNVARALLPGMVQRGRGVVVNVASTAALVPMNGSAVYGAAKAGLVALSRSVSVEYGPLGVRCHCVCPGTTETAMTERVLAVPDLRRHLEDLVPLRRVAQPGDIAEAVAYLAGPTGRGLNGLVLPVDGGYLARWGR